jgi:tRNA G10  N-methylase Trm11
MSDRLHKPTATPAPAAPRGSVFLTGQVCSREQRRGRYTKESLAHPGKMLPSIARYLIHTYSEIGDWVCDPMAGIATTVEAMHLRRHGIGVEYEARWAALAADNLRLAASQDASGTGQIVHGDFRRLPALVPTELHGQIALVITSSPYGPSTHGHARTPGHRRGKVCKINHYGADAGNLPYRDQDHLADGFTQILTGVAAILRPGGIVAITARPYRRYGELIDIPGMVFAVLVGLLRVIRGCGAVAAARRWR